MVIVAGEQSDLQELQKLYAALALDSPPAPVEKLRETFDRARKQPGFSLWIAREDKAIVGSFVLTVVEALGARCRPVALVEDVVVDKAWRRRGVGKEMMEFALLRAAEAGAYKLMLSSSDKREEAHRFYEGIGFERHGYSFVVPTL